MANSRHRRRLRRALQEAGLSMLLQTAVPTSPQASVSMWKKLTKKVFGWLYGIVALAISCVVFYPRVSATYASPVPADILLTRFTISNDSFFPITTVDSGCLIVSAWYTQPAPNFRPPVYLDWITNQPTIAKLSSEDAFTVPCSSQHILAPIAAGDVL
jgi:hypothetical protein